MRMLDRGDFLFKPLIFIDGPYSFFFFGTHSLGPLRVVTVPIISTSIINIKHGLTPYYIFSCPVKSYGPYVMLTPGLLSKYIKLLVFILDILVLLFDSLFL